jgi:hypothetical protein
MTTLFFKKYQLFLFIFMAVMTLPARSQQPFEFKIEPAVNISLKLSDRWSFTSQLKLNQLLGGNRQSGFEDPLIERLEAQIFANYSLFGSQRVSLGYLAGLDDPFKELPGLEHRLVQQYSFVWDGASLKLTFRLRAEQRFRESGFEQRYRARIGTEIPLQGERLDQGEPYLVIQEELLACLQGGKFEMGNRFDAGIGWLLPGRQRLQFQIQRRFEDFNLPARGHVIQLLTGYFLSF